MMKPLTCVLLIQNPDIERQILHCAENFNTIEILEVYKNSIEVIEKLNQVHPDILMLNVDTTDFDPIEFIKMIERPPFVIGITNHPENVIQLLDNGFFDLLMVRFTLEDFCKKISKIIKIVHDLKGTNLKYGVASDTQMQYKAKRVLPSQKDYMFLKHHRVSTKMRFDDIVYIQNVGNILKVYGSEGQFSYHSSTLSKMLHELPTDRFVRLNKSIIVNYSKIEKVERHIIYMQDQEFKLSRTYSMQMMEILNQRDSF